MDRMLNQRRVSLEQEFEWRRAESLGKNHVDFEAKTNAALERYKKGLEALERQVRDLEAELRRVHEVRRGAKPALEQADATMNAL
jgi:prefoldin subunit 5